jgi:hypothetical protein
MSCEWMRGMNKKHAVPHPQDSQSEYVFDPHLLLKLQKMDEKVNEKGNC